MSTFDQAAGQILVTRHDDERTNRSLHGLTRSLVANMVQGVTTGYTKKLEIVGVGYQAQLKKANTRGAAGRLCQPDRPGGAAGRERDGAGRHPRHHQRRRQAGRRPVRRRSSARSARPSRTKARGFATKARSSAARPARPSDRSDHPKRDPCATGHRLRHRSSRIGLRCDGSHPRRGAVSCQSPS